MRKILFLLLLVPMLGVSQVLTIGGEVLKHQNMVLRKNYIYIDGNSWVEKAPKLGAETIIHSLCVYNGKLYGGTGYNSNLYEWNGVNAWVQKAPRVNSEYSIMSLCVYNGKLYGGTYRNGFLCEWNGVNAWIEKSLGVAEYIYSLCVYNGKLYCSTTNGKLFEWDGVNALVEKAPK